MFRQVVLVVDDDPDMLSLLNTMLRRNGYVVMRAASAELALHLVKSFMPNLFVVDVLMPDMNGFELCEKIRQIPHTANVPIIVLTALARSLEPNDPAETQNTEGLFTNPPELGPTPSPKRT